VKMEYAVSKWDKALEITKGREVVE